jgi:hypothetical protein
MRKYSVNPKDPTKGVKVATAIHAQKLFHNTIRDRGSNSDEHSAGED